MDVRKTALRMKMEAPKMAGLSLDVRNKALLGIGQALNAGKDEIFRANKRDLEAAESSGVSSSVMKRLKFDEKKLSSVTEGLKSLAELSDPVGEVQLKRELSDGLVLTRLSVPIGVIGVIFEARPDALIQIASLCLKSGNMCILKGGKETKETNDTLFKIIKDAAVSAGIPEAALEMVSSHEEIGELLKCQGLVDLLIPRGSNEFVSYIMNNTTIPVLGHADGICHTYVDAGADLDLALKVLIDAKTQYTAACNSTESLLVSRAIAGKFLPMAEAALKKAGVRINGTAEAAGFMDCSIIGEDDFRKEYLDLEIGVKLVEDVKEAVFHINSYGSHHTDAIITEDEAAWNYFSLMVDSAGVYRNASTRFADGFRYGFGAEVGISTSKIHARGPVGLFGLMTYKYLLEGNGHTVTDFERGEREYNFRELTPGGSLR